MSATSTDECVDMPAKKHSLASSTPKRVQLIFSVMASSERVDMLRILKSKGPLSYSDLKDVSGFRSKRESGKFAYHLRKLSKQSLVSVNKSERRYMITNMGRLVLNLVRQLEQQTVAEGGKMYVRASDASINEFVSNKITQSLVREGNLSMDVAQRITEDVENKIYKYRTSYLTGPLIREIVNVVLLEYGHEEYRRKFSRLGVPLYELEQMLSNLDRTDEGIQGVFSSLGKKILVEHILFNILPKEISDAHFSGDVYISNPGTWSTLPDIVFVNIRDMLEGGMAVGGRNTAVSRVPAPRQFSDMADSLSVIFLLLLREASEEVVIDGLPQSLDLHGASDVTDAEIEKCLLGVFVMSSVTSIHPADGCVLSIRLDLNDDGGHDRITSCIMSAYKKYVQMTRRPHIGLVVNYGGARDIGRVSSVAAEIVLLGGRVLFTRLQQHISSRGITGGARNKAGNNISFAMLQSISLNLPRVARESDTDESLFRVKLVLMLQPIINAMVARKKALSDLIHCSHNLLTTAKDSPMQRNPMPIAINLVGLREAVFDILGLGYNKEGRTVIRKIIDTVVSVGMQRARENGERISICIADSEGAERFADLDDKKYGKQLVNLQDARPYQCGMTFAASAIRDYTGTSIPIVLTNKMDRQLNAGLQVTLDIDEKIGGDDVQAVKDAIEKMATLVPSFAPVRKIVICAECGSRGTAYEAQCPQCMAPRPA